MAKRRFSEYDSFKLAKALHDESVPLGTKGVVLMVLGGEPPAYEVEFPDDRGGNLGDAPTYTITDEYMVGTNAGGCQLA